MARITDKLIENHLTWTNARVGVDLQWGGWNGKQALMYEKGGVTLESGMTRKEMVMLMQGIRFGAKNAKNSIEIRVELRDNEWVVVEEPVQGTHWREPWPVLFRCDRFEDAAYLAEELAANGRPYYIRRDDDA